MAFRQKQFSSVRVYQVVNRFNALAARNFADDVAALRSWSVSAKMQYQRFNHRVNALWFESQPPSTNDEWHFTVLDAVKKIEKGYENSFKTWQHCAFDILEKWNKPTTEHSPRISAGWATCAQILASQNHFLKNQSNAEEPRKMIWQHAVWRIERLNRIERPRRQNAWQVAFRVIMRGDLRARRFGWYKAWFASKELNASIVLRAETSKYVAL